MCLVVCVLRVETHIVVIVVMAHYVEGVREMVRSVLCVCVFVSARLPVGSVGAWVGREDQACWRIVKSCVCVLAVSCVPV
jgi:hypothetical protein